MARGRGVRPDGRSKVEPYVRLPHWLLDCPAFLSLRPLPRALLLLLARRFNGRNNGRIGLGEREAARDLSMSDRAAVRRGFIELQERGFITCAREAGFAMKVGDRRAKEWTLAWLPVGDVSASKAFMRWRPPAGEIGGAGNLSRPG